MCYRVWQRTWLPYHMGPWRVLVEPSSYLCANSRPTCAFGERHVLYTSMLQILHVGPHTWKALFSARGEVYSTHAHMYESGRIQRIITLLLPSQPQTSTPGIASGGVHMWLKTAFTYRLSPCFTSPVFVAAKTTSPLSVLRDCFMGSARLDW